MTESMSLTYRSCSVRTPAGEMGRAGGERREAPPGHPKPVPRPGNQGGVQAEPSWGQRPRTLAPGLERASRSPALPGPGGCLPKPRTRSTACLVRGPHGRLGAQGAHRCYREAVTCSGCHCWSSRCLVPEKTETVAFHPLKMKKRGKGLP